MIRSRLQKWLDKYTPGLGSKPRRFNFISYHFTTELTGSSLIGFTSFLVITHGSNKLECYITLGWKGLSGTNSLTYWAHS
jgi:hypothetical protein